MQAHQNQPNGSAYQARERRTPAASRRTARRTLTILVLAGMLGLTACTDTKTGSWQDGGKGGGDAPKGPQVTAAITTPAANAKDVPAATEVTFKTHLATDATVELKDAAGKAVGGKLRDDGSSWVPDEELAYGTQYKATVKATGEDGKKATAENTFTTMAQPANQVRVSSFLGDNQVVGVAMPLIVRFGRDIPEELRDDVQRRLFVTSTPAQEGIWSWVSGAEVHYRPKQYWKAGTKLSYRLATGGLPMGDGWYGRSDITVAASVGSSVVLTVDNRSKQMTVTKDGKLLRKLPVSLGKAKTPSSSGTMVVIEKLRKTVFDTFAELGPTAGYRTNIEYAQRLTWGGEFIHAAPWSEGVQGETNVSHGCVNVSMANAKWLFGITKMGDPVVVKGTERRVQQGNGWTDWSLTWAEYVKGSAIPYKPPAQPSPSASGPGPSGSATPTAAASPAS